MINLMILIGFLAPSPVCLDVDRNPLPINNTQVLYWKEHTPNLFLARGHVYGTISTIYPNKNGHNHFQATIDQGTIEIIYNQSFGKLPPLEIGMGVEGCGDYITSSADTSEYKASPDGAILHWVHISDNIKHPSGWLKFWR